MSFKAKKAAFKRKIRNPTGNKTSNKPPYKSPDHSSIDPDQLKIFKKKKLDDEIKKRG